LAIKYRQIAATSGMYKSSGVWHQASVGGGVEWIETYSHDISQLGSGDEGGPFHLVRNITYPLLTKTTGGEDAWPAPATVSIASKDSTAVIKGNGTTAIARTTPTSPVFNSGVAIGETMRDGLPSVAGVHLWKERTEFYRSLGSEYLNHTFGWLPFIADIRNFMYAVKNHTKIITDLVDGSGKKTRVSYKFEPSKTDILINKNCNVATVGGGLWATSPGFIQGRTGKRTWFSGCFTYYVPLPDSTRNSMQAWLADANRLLGARLTPDLLWSMAPWTWALDWFSNTGDLIQNFSSFGQDSLVLQYGYVMNHWYQKYEIVIPANPSKGHGFCKRRVVSEESYRFPSNPYFGFGALGTLSARQAAIVAALGLTLR
jgi:hypothetical protein